MKILYFLYSIQVLFMKKYKLKVEKIIQIDAHTKTIWFQMPKGFKWSEGCSGLFAFKKAFKRFMVYVTYMRYMTVARSDDQNYLEITCRVPGSKSLFKQAMMTLDKGDEMILYSVKKHCPLVRNQKHLVFLSMGIGMVTYKNLFELFEADDKGILSVTSINVDNHQTMLYHDAYERVHKIYCQNRKAFSDIVVPYTKKAESSFYLVGSEAFLHEMIKKLKDEGVTDENIIIDRSHTMRHKRYNLQ